MDPARHAHFAVRFYREFDFFSIDLNIHQTLHLINRICISLEVFISLPMIAGLWLSISKEFWRFFLPKWNRNRLIFTRSTTRKSRFWRKTFVKCDLNSFEINIEMRFFLWFVLPLPRTEWILVQKVNWKKKNLCCHKSDLIWSNPISDGTINSTVFLITEFSIFSAIWMFVWAILFLY